jgi:hypothetical protein
MKNGLTNLMIAAAAFVAVAGTAAAQTMEAKIPFAFHVSGKTLPAGTYRVTLQSTPAGPQQLIVASPRRRNQLVALAFADRKVSADWQSSGMAVLSFQCGASQCALKNAWMGTSDLVYRIPTPKLSNDESVRTAEIVMHTVKGD